MAPKTRLTLGRKIGFFTLASLVLGLSLFSILAIQSVNESVKSTLNERLDIARIVANRLDQTLNFVLVQMRSSATGITLLPNKEDFTVLADTLQGFFHQSEISINTVYFFI